MRLGLDAYDSLPKHDAIVSRFNHADRQQPLHSNIPLCAIVFDRLYSLIDVPDDRPCLMQTVLLQQYPTR